MSKVPFPDNPTGLEVVTTRILPYPREKVHAAFMDPEQLTQWWGPLGFTFILTRFEPRPGGVWYFIQRGLDGVEYANESVFEEVGPERIVYRHLGPMYRFRMTMGFEDRGGETGLTWAMRFEVPGSETLRDYVEVANEENLDRLEAFLKDKV